MTSTYSNSNEGYCAICGADISNELEAGYYEECYYYEPYTCPKCNNKGEQVFQVNYTYIESNGFIDT